MIDPLKAIRELIGAMREWLRHPVDPMCPDELLRAEQYVAEAAIPKLDEMERALTAAELELREREYPHLPWCNGNRKFPAGIPGHSCCCLNLPEQTEIRKLRSEADSRVAAAFALAAQVPDKSSDALAVAEGMPSCQAPMTAAMVSKEIAKAIRKRTPPEATAALEKMLLEARREEWRMLNFELADVVDARHLAERLHKLMAYARKRTDELSVKHAQLAALTGEKKAQVKP